MLRALFGDDAGVLEERAFQTLVVAGSVGVLGTALVSPILESLIAPFGTSEANIGLMISLFTAPAILMNPLAGVLADRFGRKPILVGSLLLFGLAGSAIAFTDDFRMVLVLRFLQGVGFGGINPIVITSFGDLYTGTKETTAQGLRITGAGISSSVLPVLAGFLVVVAWQYPFLLYSVTIPVAALVWLAYDESEKPDSEAGPESNSASDSEPTAERTSSREGWGSYVRSLGTLLARPRVFALVVGLGLPNVVWYAFVTYNSLVVVQIIGASPPHAGVLVALGSLLFAVVASQAGRILSTFDSYLWPLVWGNLLLIAGFVTFLFAPTIPVAGLGVTLLGFGFGILSTLYRSIITELAPRSLRAGLVGLAESGARITATITPILMGAIVAALTPAAGSELALQVAGISAALAGGGGGLLCLLAVRIWTPAEPESDFDVIV